MTRREEIIGILEKEEKSGQELANHFKIDAPEILEDLMHIELSIKPRKLIRKPAKCKKCGFTFKERSKVKKPSKCPRCNSEWILAPLFRIEA